MTDEEQQEINDLRRKAGLADLPLIGRGASLFKERLAAVWEQGFPSGSKTGWPSVDKHYTVMPGQLTVLTGWPGSGKSEWLDALLLNLAHQGWRFCLFSAENMPHEVHVIKYLEKLNRKPFGYGRNERMTLDEVVEGATEIDDWFKFLGPSFSTEKLSFSIEQVLGAAESEWRDMGIWQKRENRLGLVIDPWNELEHLRPKDVSETEYISATLSYVRQWARTNDVHVWMVAHPQKLKRDDSGKLPIPRPDAISGSQHWWNKADVAITVWRDMGERASDETDIHVWKVRFKNIGYPGKITLRYDRVTGCYSEPPRIGLEAVS